MSARSLIEAGLRALVPEISRISSQITKEAENRIKSIYNRALKMIIIYGATLFAVLFFLAPLIFSIWLGENSTKTMPIAFRLMLVGTFMSLLGVPAYYTLMGTNRVAHCLASHVVQSMVNFIIILSTVIIIHTLDVQQVVLAVATGMSLSSIYLLTTMRITLKNSYTKN
jgi:O-antigen/teichoic acid export membrane protein